MSKKIKFTVFELMLLGGVAMFMIIMLLLYHHPDMLPVSIYGNYDIPGVSESADISVMFHKLFNSLMIFFGALFMLFWGIFVVAFYLLQRRSFRRERRKYLKKIGAFEARVEKVFLKLNNEIATLSQCLENKIEKDAEKKEGNVQK
ncbi:MAG: hypothetical protein ACYC4Q_08690 [Victivallaceae bacterium]